jgi:hypothetical protein
MIKCFVVAVALASLLVVGCEQQPTAPPSGQPPSSPSPAASPVTTPSPESQATPESTASATPAVTPETAATPAVTAESTATLATPEATATPAPSPAATPDAISPSPTSSPSASESDVRPTLSSRSANEYLQSYDDYITDFKSASKAMKEGDMTKYQSVIRRAHELRTKSEKLGGELNPEEEQRFANYLNKKANELAQFASQNP